MQLDDFIQGGAEGDMTQKILIGLVVLAVVYLAYAYYQGLAPFTKEDDKTGDDPKAAYRGYY